MIYFSLFLSTLPASLCADENYECLYKNTYHVKPLYIHSISHSHTHNTHSLTPIIGFRLKVFQGFRFFPCNHAYNRQNKSYNHIPPRKEKEHLGKKIQYPVKDKYGRHYGQKNQVKRREPKMEHL